MRSCLPDYELVAPANLREALALMAGEPGAWKPFAGGTDLMVLLEAGKLPHKRFLSLWHLRELKGIEVSPTAVTLGALTTYTEVLRHPVLQQEFPCLCQGARETGGVATQNRGTLGGNIANASPAADSPPALLVYDAELELVSATGSRWVPYRGFHSSYKQMDLRPNELIARIRLPRVGRPRRHYYRKVGTRKAQAISKVVFAGVAEVEGGVVRDVRIALGSVAPTVLRCAKTEAVLRGHPTVESTVAAAQAALAGEIAPIDDFRSTAKYRRRVSLNLLAVFLQSCLGTVEQGPGPEPWYGA
ncbi:MAG: xanthine dehydrogenase family protein subunit M [Acidobacteria bacterium]|nr:xanthine dehydrogenase family protein subunit M [Acidobacteriota bacterium]